MVAELRAVRAELDNQRHFTPEKQPIELTRDYLHRWTVGVERPEPETQVAKTATSLSRASDEIEVG